jgi:hypothetical protein
MNATRTSRLPVLPNAEAWARLPGAPAAVEALPAWARMLAGPLPLTTARALELDALHRTGPTLDERLRAVARWAGADANGCDYAKAMAGDAAIPASDVERKVAAFSRTMMTEAFAVTDAEVAELLAILDEERLVALVALLAHAAYQDRLLLALGAEAEAQVPPPITTRFARSRPPAASASAAQMMPVNETTTDAAAQRHWAQLREGLANQKSRPGRIRVPSREEMLRRIGEGNPLAWQAGLAWSRVCYTFQPELTDAWFGCTAAFRQETDLDAVFQTSVFWVITEALRCFY